MAANDGSYGPGKSRMVPLEVIVVGLPRTGTWSIMLALEELGYIETFHIPKGLEPGSAEPELWIKALDAKFGGKGKLFEKEDWDLLLGRYMATTDAPSIYFAEELMTFYPDAKVILSTRDTAIQWCESMSTVAALTEDATYRRGDLLSSIWRWFIPVSPGIALHDAVIKYIPTVNPGTGLEGQSIYNEHNDRMRQFCKKNNRDYLEFNVKQGWVPLCEYLGKDIPKIEFPRSNERAAMKENLRGLKADTDKAARKNILKYLKVFGIVGIVGMAIFLSRKPGFSF